MKLIAKRPCSFGGRTFFIGEEIPEEMVSDPQSQEKLGVIAIANGITSDAEKEKSAEHRVAIKVGNDGEEDIFTVISLTQEQLQQSVELMQSNAEKVSDAVENLDRNILFMLAFVDGRNTVRKTAKHKLDNLSIKDNENNDARGGNELLDGKDGGN